MSDRGTTQIDALVRDATSVTPMSKSEFRARLLNLLDGEMREELVRHITNLAWTQGYIKVNHQIEAKTFIDNELDLAEKRLAALRDEQRARLKG